MMALNSKEADTECSLLARASIRSELEQSWWMYPIARFFGHALFEYRYDIDYSEHAGNTFQERNLILYKSYCDLLGSLVAKYVIDRGNGTKAPDVVMGMIGYAFTHSEDKREKQGMDSLSECIFIKENHEYYEELHRVFDFCEHFHLPSILSSIPFICKIGIKLNSGPSYNDLMKDFELQYTKAASYMKATGFLKDKKEVLKKKEEALEDENKGSEDEDTTLKDLAKSVGDIEVEDKTEFVSPSEDTLHDETMATRNPTLPLSPYDAIQAVIEKYKSANESIPTNLLSNLSHLKTKDPYREYARSKSTKSLSPSLAQTTKGESPSLTSRQVSNKDFSPASTSQSPAVTQSDLVPSAAVQYKSKEKSLSPKLAFSSGFFSSDAAIRNKIIVDLPNSDNGRENYILHEYDCRMKKHIAFQAANFELLHAKKGMYELSNLIRQQRKFEESWAFRYSETTPSEEFYDESVFDIEVEVREFDMTEMVKESQQVIEMLQQLLSSVDTIKCR